VCPDGYEDVDGDGTDCREIDECTEGGNDCHELADCENTPGDFTCDCPAGYSGDGTGRNGCIDIDECTTGAHDCDPQVSCDGTTPAGSWICGSCPEHHTGGGTLDDPCVLPTLLNGGFDEGLISWSVSEDVTWDELNRDGHDASGSLWLIGPAHQYASQCISICDGAECASSAEATAWVFSADYNAEGRAMLQIVTYPDEDCEGDDSGRQTTVNGRPQPNEWLLKEATHTLPEGTTSISVLVSAWAGSGDFSTNWDDITIELD